MSFSSQKGEFDRFFNRLDRPVEESRPDRQSDRPVDPTGFHLWYVPKPEKHKDEPEKWSDAKIRPEKVQKLIKLV